MNVLYYDEEGNEVIAANLVTEMKVGINGTFMSFIAAVPPNLRDEHNIAKMVSDLEQLIRDTTGNAQQTAQPAAGQPALPGVASKGLVNFVSAKERQPGSDYWVEVDTYSVDGERISFFGPNSKYAKLGHYNDRSDFLTAFNGWKPTDIVDAPMPGGPIWLHIGVTDKMRGDYYDQTILGISREWPPVAVSEDTDGEPF